MNWPFVFVVIYFFLFISACLGLAIWRMKQRKARPPVVFKLLRGPGETLRKRMAKFDEDLPGVLAFWSIVPLAALFPTSWVWIRFVPPSTWTQFWFWLALTVVVLAVGLLVSIRQVTKRLFRYRSDRLGYLGERFVGEKLAVLERHGFSVYHDVPAEGGGRAFNLDHVVVGPTGLWLIETKTRRKGPARPGFAEHEVAFDGSKLIWPWGEDSHGVEQAQDEARWLSEWINKRTGFGVEARAILALPGWMVKERKLGAVRVLNPINIPTAIKGRGQVVLTSEQIDIIARQLDEKCRDVED